MRKHFIPLLLAAVCLLSGCAASANEQEPTETMVVYKALPLPDLFVDIPEGYEETSSQFYDRYYIKDDAMIIITEDNEKGTMSPHDYSIDALTQYYKITHSLDMIHDEVVSAGNRDVQTLEFTYTLEEGGDAFSTMVGFSSDGITMYIITCKCNAANYEQHREEFLTVIRSQRSDKTGLGSATENVEPVPAGPVQQPVAQQVQ
jgi:hypothetical protein